MLRYDWSKEDVQEIYNLSFPELVYRAMTVHREHFPSDKIQRSTLLSIKTGFCPEDCSYCPQSAHYDTGIDKHGLLPREFIVEKALEAKNKGSTRFCMGAAWREVKDGEQFDAVLDVVSAVAGLDMEVCCTMGMLSETQAERLKDAGCHAYNHNLDTSPEFYGNIISTRTYQDRLDTLQRVRKAGMTVCSGGIVGMGESTADRLELLRQLATQSPHPESVPLNMLIRVEGTPLANENQQVDPIDFVRLVATARILMPSSLVRLSAGRTQMSDETQAMAFLAGANSIHSGEKLLTTANPGDDHDDRLITRLGMSFVGKEDGCGCGHKEHHHHDNERHAVNS